MVIVLNFFMLISCSHEGSSDVTYHAPKSGPHVMSAIYRDVPFINGKQCWYYTPFQEYIKKLGLDTLTAGFDSLQIRITFAYNFSNIEHMVVIARSENAWSADFLTMSYAEDDSSKGKASKTILYNLTPRDGWERFTTAIIDIGVLNLPDMANLKDRDVVEFADGNSYIVEIATANSYRIYSYGALDLTRQYFSEARTFENIMLIIKNELNLRDLRIE